MENAKIQKLKCDIWGDFQTLCLVTTVVVIRQCKNQRFSFLVLERWTKADQDRWKFCVVTFFVATAKCSSSLQEFGSLFDQVDLQECNEKHEIDQEFQSYFYATPHGSFPVGKQLFWAMTNGWGPQYGHGH